MDYNKLIFYHCVLKVTCPTIVVGTLGKCGNIGEYGDEQIIIPCGNSFLMNFNFLFQIIFWIGSRKFSLPFWNDVVA